MAPEILHNKDNHFRIYLHPYCMYVCITGNKHNIITVTAKETKTKNLIPLGVPRRRINKIEVFVPAKLKPHVKAHRKQKFLITVKYID